MARTRRAARVHVRIADFLHQVGPLRAARTDGARDRRVGGRRRERRRVVRGRSRGRRGRRVRRHLSTGKSGVGCTTAVRSESVSYLGRVERRWSAGRRRHEHGWILKRRTSMSDQFLWSDRNATIHITAHTHTHKTHTGHALRHSTHLERVAVHLASRALLPLLTQPLGRKRSTWTTQPEVCSAPTSQTRYGGGQTNFRSTQIWSKPGEADASDAAKNTCVV